VEHLFLVQLDCHLGASCALEPLERIQQAFYKPALDVAPEEDLLVVVEDAVAEQAVVSGGKAASGYRADDVDLVEQPMALSVDLDGCVSQFQQYPVGKCRGASSAAGERQHQGQVVGSIAGRDLLFDRVSGTGVGHLHGRVVDHAVGSAAGEQNECEKSEIWFSHDSTLSIVETFHRSD
jgi:hypothetical protein